MRLLLLRFFGGDFEISRLAVVGGLEFSVRQSSYALSAETFPVDASGTAGSEKSADLFWLKLKES
jgi:hypothetical protein